MIQFWDALNTFSMLMRKKGTGTSDEGLKYVGITLYFGKKEIDLLDIETGIYKLSL